MARIRVVGFAGCALDEKGQEIGTKQVGKDTVAQMLEDFCSFNKKIVVHKLSFAWELNRVMGDFYELDPAVMNTPLRKETPNVVGNFSWRQTLKTFASGVVCRNLEAGLKTGHQFQHLWVDKLYGKKLSQFFVFLMFFTDTFKL